MKIGVFLTPNSIREQINHTGEHVFINISPKTMSFPRKGGFFGKLCRIPYGFS
jgi:hypothetical protein